jgi:hypothetical protein
MDVNVNEYGQMDFNLPHDLVPLPSGGVFYPNKKKSVKVGYLTAADENIIINMDGRKTIKETVILPLLRNKIYEPDIRPEDLLDGDIEAILLFLRNTSFGPEYTVSINDPATGKPFDATILLDELNIKKCDTLPESDGTFTIVLPRSKATVKLKPLNMRESIEVENILETYPQGRTAPTITVRLNKMIIEVNGSNNKLDISKFIETMPIMDSKYIRKFLYDNEPRLDLTKEVKAPSGERAVVDIAFGVEFFRPFFSL